MSASTFDSQVGYAVESTFNTFVAPTRALEHVMFGLKSVRPDIVSKGKKAGRRHQGRRNKGLEACSGTISHELSPINTGMLFTQAMGAVASSGSGPFTNIYTPGPLIETRSLSVQGGVPSDDGTVNPFNFTGCQINAAKIKCKTGEVAMIELDFVAAHMQNTGDGDTVIGLTAASYSSTWAPYTCLHAVITVNASVYECDDFEIAIANNMKTGRYFHRATTPSQAKQAKESGWRDFTATLNGPFFNLVAQNRAFAGTEVAFSCVFTNGANLLTIAGNMRTQVETPTDDGATDVVTQGLKLDFVSLTSDAAAMTITQVTTDATP